MIERFLFMTRILLLFCCFFFGTATVLYSQVPDSIEVLTKRPDLRLDTIFQIDTTDVLVETDTTEKGKIIRFFKDDYPNPKKALLFSLILPGAGQVYNKKWWKLPFVYGAIGGLGYLIDRNTNDYIILKRNHRRKVRGLPHDFTGTRLDDAAKLRLERDQADKNRQISYIGFVVVYALNGVEAFVDAHLAGFDVDEDLGFDLKPSFETTPTGTPAVGIGITLTIK
jgi:hypothetical protein